MTLEVIHGPKGVGDLEYSVEENSGIMLASGAWQEWEGFRITYRPVGTRRWRHFNFLDGTREQCHIAVLAHALKEAEINRGRNK